MLKKIFKYIVCIIVISFLIFAPKLLTEKYYNQYLTDTLQEKWTGVISMWDIPRLTIKGSSFGWIKERIGLFEKQNPGVFIDLRELHYDDNKELAFRAAVSENHPDIMPLFIDGEAIPLDNVISINFLNNDSDIFELKEELIATVYNNGQIWGVPIYYSTNVIIVNNEILQRFGLQLPEENKEWSIQDFVVFLNSICQKDTKKEFIPFDLYIEKNEYNYMPFLLSDGGNFYIEENESFSFYNSDLVSGLQRIQYIKNKVNNLHEDFGQRDRKEVLDDFLKNQKIVMIAGDLDDVNYLSRRVERGNGFDYTVISYPIGNLDLSVSFANEVGCYSILKSDDKEKEEVIIKFLKFLLNESSQQSVIKLGKYPATKGYQIDFKQLDYLEKLREKTYLLHIIPFSNQWSSIEEKIRSEIKRSLCDNQTAVETLYFIQRYIENTN